MGRGDRKGERMRNIVKDNKGSLQTMLIYVGTMQSLDFAVNDFLNNTDCIIEKVLVLDVRRILIFYTELYTG